MIIAAASVALLLHRRCRARGLQASAWRRELLPSRARCVAFLNTTPLSCIAHCKYGLTIFFLFQSVLFKLVVRNEKNKPQVRDLAVPVHTNIAKSSLVALEERDLEREKLKQRVLQHHERQKEEEALHGSEFHIRVRFSQQIDSALPVPQ